MARLKLKRLARDIRRAIAWRVEPRPPIQDAGIAIAKSLSGLKVSRCEAVKVGAYSVDGDCMITVGVMPEAVERESSRRDRRWEIGRAVDDALEAAQIEYPSLLTLYDPCRAEDRDAWSRCDDAVFCVETSND